jgi:replicative DNA helicase
MSALLSTFDSSGYGADRQIAQLRIPPHSIEGESSVLGGLLLDNTAWDRVGDLLADQDFYRHEHQLIYAAIGKLINDSKPADIITVYERLQSQGKAEEVGGLAYLNALAQYVPSAGNIRRYAEIVRERSILRKLVAASDEIATNAFNPQGKAVTAILDEAEQKILNIGEQGGRSQQGFQSMDTLVVDLLDRVTEMAENPNDVTGVPTGFHDLDRMTSGFQAGDLVILAARPSMGKAQPLDANIRTLSGWKRMGELEVGDALASVDGRTSIVTGIFPQGVRQTYRVTFSDGRSTQCCGEHLWRVMHRDWDAPRIVSADQLREMLTKVRYQGRLWIDTVSGDFGSLEALPVEPWLLGSLLGDGSLSGTGEALDALGLSGLTSERKFIPALYLNAGKEARLALLRGLVATDGWVEKWGGIRFSTVSERLASDVALLVRSLGGWCSITQKQPHFVNADGIRVPGLPAYVCHISHPDPKSLMSLAEKQQRAPQQRLRQKRLTVTSIAPVRLAECQCISVSHPDHLYVTDDYIVTHNTALAINIAEHVALHEGLPVAVFSMEMGASQLAVRIVGSIGRIDQTHLRTGALTDEEWPRLTEAIEKLRSISLHIDETAGLTVSELRANARRLARQCGKLGLIVVDYLQLMSVSTSMNDENRATAVGEISRGLKMLAKELQCPVIALSQLSRGVESRTDKRPMMSDLRESGAIEQDADIIMFIYRDEYYTKEACKEPGVAEVIISKQRNGPTGTVKLAFINRITKFESLAHSSGDF